VSADPWARLRERKLFQWGVAYLAGAWLLLQVIDLLAGTFHWPDRVQQVATMLLAVGFLAALVLAWYHGERGAQRVVPMELAIFAVLCIIAGAAVAFVARPAPGLGSAGEATPASVAVLPFVNMSADSEQEYFSDGITEEILNRLAKVPALRVAARTSSFQFKGVKADVREVGAKLGVAHVLEGSVRKAGDRVRITAQLIDARNGYHLWSESYDRELKDIFQVQDEIARAIAGALRVRLGEGAQAAARSPNLEAYDLFLRARFLLYQATGTSLRSAIDLFRETLALEPSYAEAHAGIAYAYAFLADFYLPPREAYTEARKAAREALELDRSSAEAHALLGYTLAVLDYDHVAAEREFRRAIESNPNSADAHFLFAQFLCGIGRTAEGLVEAERAMTLNPLSGLFGWNRGICLLLSRRYDDVIEQDRSIQELEPAFFYYESWGAAAQRQRAQYESALAHYRRIQPLVGEMPLFGLGVTYARMGRRAEALASASTGERPRSSGFRGRGSSA